MQVRLNFRSFIQNFLHLTVSKVRMAIAKMRMMMPVPTYWV